jgi:hypothetical protein
MTDIDINIEQNVSEFDVNVETSVTNITVEVQVGGTSTVAVTWENYALNIKYTDQITEITDGKVLEGVKAGATVYRFINNTRVDKYPIEDSFYSNFDGTNLTGLIVTRG